MWNHEFRVSCGDGDNLDFIIKDKDIWPKRDDILGSATLLNKYFYDQGFEGDLALADSASSNRPKLHVRIAPVFTAATAAGAGSVVLGMAAQDDG